MTAKKEAEQAKGDVEEQIDEEEEQGYRGQKVDEHPDSAYTLESGPDSPPYTDEQAEKKGK